MENVREVEIDVELSLVCRTLKPCVARLSLLPCTSYLSLRYFYMKS